MLNNYEIGMERVFLDITLVMDHCLNYVENITFIITLESLFKYVLFIFYYNIYFYMLFDSLLESLF